MAAMERILALNGDQLLVRTGTLQSIKSFGSQASAAASAVSAAVSNVNNQSGKAAGPSRPGDDDVVIDPYELNSSDFEESDSGTDRDLDSDLGDPNDWASDVQGDGSVLGSVDESTPLGGGRGLSFARSRLGSAAATRTLGGGGRSRPGSAGTVRTIGAMSMKSRVGNGMSFKSRTGGAAAAAAAAARSGMSFTSRPGAIGGGAPTGGVGAVSRKSRVGIDVPESVEGDGDASGATFSPSRFSGIAIRKSSVVSVPLRRTSVAGGGAAAAAYRRTSMAGGAAAAAAASPHRSSIGGATSTSPHSIGGGGGVRVLEERVSYRSRTSGSTSGAAASAAAAPSIASRSMYLSKPHGANGAPSVVASSRGARSRRGGTAPTILDERLNGRAVRKRLQRHRGWDFQLREEEVDYHLGRALPDVLTRPQPTVNSEDEESSEEEGGNGGGDDEDGSVVGAAGRSQPPGPTLEAIKAYAHEKAPEVLWSERLRLAKLKARASGQAVTVRGRMDAKRRRELLRKVQKWDNREWFDRRKRAPPAPPLHPAVARVIEQWFALVDDDGSGTLDHSELLAALRASNVPVNANNINEMIDLMDMDGDGVINWKEFETFFMYEFAAGKNLLSGEYVLPSGVALPFGVMIAKLKRNKLLGDLIGGGIARAKWSDIADSPLALEDELGVMAAVELAMEEMKNPALGRQRARAAKAVSRLPPHLRTPSLTRHLQRHPEITERLLRAPSISALLMNTMKRVPSTSSAVVARLASMRSASSAISRTSSVNGNIVSQSSFSGGSGGGSSGGGRVGNVDLNVAAALAAGLEWPVGGANFYNRRARTVLRAACQRPPDALARTYKAASPAVGGGAGGLGGGIGGMGVGLGGLGGAAAAAAGGGPGLSGGFGAAATAGGGFGGVEGGGEDASSAGGGSPGAGLANSKLLAMKGSSSKQLGSKRVASRRLGRSGRSGRMGQSLGRSGRRGGSDDEEEDKADTESSSSGEVLPWLVNAKRRAEEEREELRQQLKVEGGGGGGAADAGGFGGLGGGAGGGGGDDSDDDEGEGEGEDADVWVSPMLRKWLQQQNRSSQVLGDVSGGGGDADALAAQPSPTLESQMDGIKRLLESSNLGVSNGVAALLKLKGNRGGGGGGGLLGAGSGGGGGGDSDDDDDDSDGIGGGIAVGRTASVTSASAVAAAREALLRMPYSDRGSITPVTPARTDTEWSPMAPPPPAAPPPLAAARPPSHLHHLHAHPHLPPHMAMAVAEAAPWLVAEGSPGTPLGREASTYSFMGATGPSFLGASGPSFMGAAGPSFIGASGPSFMGASGPSMMLEGSSNKPRKPRRRMRFEDEPEEPAEDPAPANLESDVEGGGRESATAVLGGPEMSAASFASANRPPSGHLIRALGSHESSFHETSSARATLKRASGGGGGGEHTSGEEESDGGGLAAVATSPTTHAGPLRVLIQESSDIRSGGTPTPDPILNRRHPAYVGFASSQTPSSAADGGGGGGAADAFGYRTSAGGIPGGTPLASSLRPALVHNPGGGLSGGGSGGGGGVMVRSPAVEAVHLTHGLYDRKYGSGGDWDDGGGGGGGGGGAGGGGFMGLAGYDSADLEDLDVEEAREIMTNIKLHMSKEDALFDIHTGHEAYRPSTRDFQTALANTRRQAASFLQSHNLPTHPEFSGAVAVAAATAALGVKPAATAATAAAPPGASVSGFRGVTASGGGGVGGGGTSSGGAVPGQSTARGGQNNRTSKQVIAGRSHLGLLISGVHVNHPTATTATTTHGMPYRSATIGGSVGPSRGVTGNGSSAPSRAVTCSGAGVATAIGGGGGGGGGGPSISGATAAALTAAAAAIVATSAAPPPLAELSGMQDAAAVATVRSRSGSRPESRSRPAVHSSAPGSRPTSQTASPRHLLPTLGSGSISGGGGIALSAPPPVLQSHNSCPPPRSPPLITLAAAAASPPAAATAPGFQSAVSVSGFDALYAAGTAERTAAVTDAAARRRATSAGSRTQAARTAAPSPSPPPPAPPPPGASAPLVWDARVAALMQRHTAAELAALEARSLRNRPLTYSQQDGGAGGVTSASPKPATPTGGSRSVGGGVAAAAARAAAPFRKRANSSIGLIVASNDSQRHRKPAEAPEEAPEGSEGTADRLLGPAGSKLPDFIPFPGAMPRLQSRYAAKRQAATASGDSEELAAAVNAAAAAAAARRSAAVAAAAAAAETAAAGNTTTAPGADAGDASVGDVSGGMVDVSANQLGSGGATADAAATAAGATAAAAAATGSADPTAEAAVVAASDERGADSASFVLLSKDASQRTVDSANTTDSRPSTAGPDLPSEPLLSAQPSTALPLLSTLPTTPAPASQTDVAGTATEDAAASAVGVATVALGGEQTQQQEQQQQSPSKGAAAEGTSAAAATLYVGRNGAFAPLPIARILPAYDGSTSTVASASAMTATAAAAAAAATARLLPTIASDRSVLSEAPSTSAGELAASEPPPPPLLSVVRSSIDFADKREEAWKSGGIVEAEGERRQEEGARSLAAEASGTLPQEVAGGAEMAEAGTAAVAAEQAAGLTLAEADGGADGVTEVVMVGSAAATAAAAKAADSVKALLEYGKPTTPALARLERAAMRPSATSAAPSRLRPDPAAAAAAVATASDAQAAPHIGPYSGVVGSGAGGYVLPTPSRLKMMTSAPSVHGSHAPPAPPPQQQPHGHKAALAAPPPPPPAASTSATQLGAGAQAAALIGDLVGMVALGRAAGPRTTSDGVVGGGGAVSPVAGELLSEPSAVRRRGYAPTPGRSRTLQLIPLATVHAADLGYAPSMPSQQPYQPPQPLRPVQGPRPAVLSAGHQHHAHQAPHGPPPPPAPSALAPYSHHAHFGVGPTAGGGGGGGGGGGNYSRSGATSPTLPEPPPLVLPPLHDPGSYVGGHRSNATSGDGTAGGTALLAEAHVRPPYRRRSAVAESIPSLPMLPQNRRSQESAPASPVTHGAAAAADGGDVSAGGAAVGSGVSTAIHSGAASPRLPMRAFSSGSALMHHSAASAATAAAAAALASVRQQYNGHYNNHHNHQHPKLHKHSSSVVHKSAWENEAAAAPSMAAVGAVFAPAPPAAPLVAPVVSSLSDLPDIVTLLSEPRSLMGSGPIRIRKMDY